MIKLYHYVHCPFCVRVRMGLGVLNIPYQSLVTPYDDEETPKNLTGVKMLPIMVDEGGIPKNESLNILHTLDRGDDLSFKVLSEWGEELDEWLAKIGSPVHNLAMPYWIWTPEFDEKSRAYFQSKKEKKRGPFYKLVKRRSEFESEILEVLGELSPHLSPYYKNSKLTIADIMLAAHLWGLYVVPEFQMPPEIHQYLQQLARECHFNYHEDYWRSESFSARKT